MSLMATVFPTASCTIHLDSPDPIFEWFLPSSTIFLSRGAREQLGLGDRAALSIHEYSSHIPQENLARLASMTAEMLRDSNVSLQEIIHPFDALLVHAHLLVTEREKTGQARRIVGHLAISKQRAYKPSLVKNRDISLQGFWKVETATDSVRLDSNCAGLLGFADEASRKISIREGLALIHPEDVEKVTKRYQLLFEHGQWGNSLEEVLRIRLENGEYARFCVYATVMMRNSDGSVGEIFGYLHSADILTPAEDNDVGNLLYAINATGDGLWDWDAKTNEVYYSPRYLSMLGYTASEFPATLDGWIKKIHPDDVGKIVPPQLAIASSPKNGDSFECTYRMQRADGSYAWILGRGYVTRRDENGQATRIVGLHTDISATQGDRAKLEDQIRNDPLTGLRSRAFFNMEVDRIEREEIRPVSVVTCDLDGLKLINDYLGHNSGDTLLQNFATLLRTVCRSTDCIGHMGGDEFSILLPSCPNWKAKELVLDIERAMQEFNRQVDVIPLFASLGVASAETMDVPMTRLIISADRSMLKRKHQQREKSHEAIRAYIERSKQILVSLEDCRY